MVFQFNQLTLDTAQYRLFQSGKTISVEPQVFDLLAYLVENRERVVSRDELLENLWQGKVVTDAALGVCLKDARKAVGDSGTRQEIIKTIYGRGYQFIAQVTESTADASAPNIQTDFKSGIGLAEQSTVQYCHSIDGTSIAHAEVGNGYPLVMTGSWLTHLEEDWEFPGWGHLASNLANDFTLIRYDLRGNGMSDWDNVDISFDKMVDDLGIVIDCYGYEKVAIFGGSAAASTAIAYSLQQPERVSHLILYGGTVRGRRRLDDLDSVAESEAMATLIRQAWGRDNPVARQMMTSLYTPEANQEEATWFNNFQKSCGPAENIARFVEVYDEIDITELLDKVNVPTLVVHCVGDTVVPFSQGKLLASRIKGAKFVTLNSIGHMVLENDPEFSRFLNAVSDFLKPANG